MHIGSGRGQGDQLNVVCPHLMNQVTKDRKAGDYLGFGDCRLDATQHGGE